MTAVPRDLSREIARMSSAGLGHVPGQGGASQVHEDADPVTSSAGMLSYCAGPLRLMAVHAHPDDESSKGAATMARYVREGVEVLVCTMTGGERGDVLNPAMDRPEGRADLARIRRDDMARAREIIGVDQRFPRFFASG